MNAPVLEHIRKSRNASKKDFTECLARALLEGAGGTLTSRQPRSGFSAVLRRAYEGIPQIIGSTEDGVVVISVRDLAELLEVARELTLGETLVSAGFKPYRSHINVEERRDSERLKRRE